jgi:hypothetical protein
MPCGPTSRIAPRRQELLCSDYSELARCTSHRIAKTATDHDSLEKVRKDNEIAIPAQSFVRTEPLPSARLMIWF